ncbi:MULTISPECIES: HAMP domain-containing sensor histidine kinase [unclassified Nocardioides]|uniref:HAMP domain-containing sensor histidine kinase n=1 Tax=unclassified Nocardioides TaxID=2615069 RepID=UPI0000571AF3|nr:MULTISPECIES: HAMP domain-containing sensor histidine kinase [unclassified Nocardioides]ABL83920.1 ATP-binding region, ATPase domain protein [Nocardioides sp. JS614]
MSLRARILTLAVGATATVLVLFAIPLVLLLQRTATEESREGASDVARSVADYVSTGPADAALLGAYVDRLNAREESTPVTVLLPDGTALGADLPAAAGEHEERRPGPTVNGSDDGDSDDDGDNRLMPVSDAEVHEVGGGQLVSVHAGTSDGDAVVLAYASGADVRAKLLDRLLLLGAAAAGLLVLAAVAAEVVARRLVRQLASTATAADRLGEGDLTARAPDDGPSEVRRVAHALNRLAGRIDDLLAAERETVADLSHRLRTPLTAVRLDVEALPPSERTEELEAHLDQLERTLTAVIHAARRPEREGALPRADAAAVVDDRVDFWRPLAEDQGRTVATRIMPGPVLVRCAEDDLRAALDALLENCMAHTPDGTPIEVELAAAGGLVRLDVRDRGPGLPEDAVRRGRSDRGSTGLGLDIARSCAEASGGRLELDRRDGWTVVRLLLGRP